MAFLRDEFLKRLWFRSGWAVLGIAGQARRSWCSQRVEKMKFQIPSENVSCTPATKRVFLHRCIYYRALSIYLGCWIRRLIGSVSKLKMIQGISVDDSKMDRYWASETIRTREIDIGQTLRKPDREQSFRKRRIKRDRIIVTFVEKYILIDRCNFSMCFIWEFFEIESKDGLPFQKFFKVAGCVARCFGGL